MCFISSNAAVNFWKRQLAVLYDFRVPLPIFCSRVWKFVTVIWQTTLCCAVFVGRERV